MEDLQEGVLVVDANHYQRLAYGTANHSLDPEKELTVAALGLAGEAGEVADHVKKYLGHGQPINDEKLIKEMGDVLWYIALLCTNRGWCLADIMDANIEKLKARWPKGFDPSSPNARGDLEDKAQ